jgi:hypothetical protein
MLAWFGQELAQLPSTQHQHSKTAAAAAAEGSNSPLQAIVAGLGVPLGSAGLQAAAVSSAAAAGAPADTVAGSRSEADVEDEGALSGPRLAAAFQQWVTAAGPQADVEFRVKP